MSVSKQVAKWRQDRKNNRAGWKQITTWIERQDEELLKPLFNMLAGGSFDDEVDEFQASITYRNARHYRDQASRWTYRQRPVWYEFMGLSAHAEIDAPTAGDRIRQLPIGGRVHDGPTRIELTPIQAEEVRIKCQKALENTLTQWIDDNKLENVIHDDTGVVVNPFYSDDTDTGLNRHGNIRRQDPRAFAENERHLLHSIMETIEASYKHRDNNPDIYYYQGYWSPSRCFVVTEEKNGVLYVALGQVHNGGTSPTNVFEHIATELLERRFQKTAPENIVWLNCYRKWFNDKIHISEVKMAIDHKRRYSNPSWLEVEYIPSSLADRMTANILEDFAANREP